MNDGPSYFLRTIPGELDAQTNLNVWTEKNWTRLYLKDHPQENCIVPSVLPETTIHWSKVWVYS